MLAGAAVVSHDMILMPSARRLPAEWEPQSGVMLTWPHAKTDWLDQLEQVERLYAEIATLIGGFEPVLSVCYDQAHLARVRALIGSAGGNLSAHRFAIAPCNDTWARDHGPIGVLDDEGQPLLLDFRFNGWGGKFAADLDDRINLTLLQSGAFQLTRLEWVELVLEGGAIETDGQGTFLIVTRTLVDPRRNPGWSRAAIEQVLRERLGARLVHWLEHGALSGDDTDGHVDTLVRFCAQDTLCFVRCLDPADPDFAALAAMQQELSRLRDPAGRPYRLVPLPSPAPLLDRDGRRLPASYANFLVINGAVLAPAYADPADIEAAAILGSLFPGRQILMVDCRPLIRQGGSLHCISLQLMAGVLA